MGEPSAMNVFAVSDLALGRMPASATSSSSWFVGSLSGPETRGAYAGPPTTEPRKTTLTQSRSVNAYARNSRYSRPSSDVSPPNVIRRHQLMRRGLRVSCSPCRRLLREPGACLRPTRGFASRTSASTVRRRLRAGRWGARRRPAAPGGRASARAPPAVLEVECVELALVRDVRMRSDDLLRTSSAATKRRTRSRLQRAPSARVPACAGWGTGVDSQRTLKPNGLLHAVAPRIVTARTLRPQGVWLTREPRKHEIDGGGRDPDRGDRVLIRPPRRVAVSSSDPLSSALGAVTFTARQNLPEAARSRRSTRRRSCRRTTGSWRARTRSRTLHEQGSRRRRACARTCASTTRSAEARTHEGPWARREAQPQPRWPGECRGEPRQRGRGEPHASRDHVGTSGLKQIHARASRPNRRLARSVDTTRPRSGRLQGSARPKSALADFGPARQD